MATSCPARSLDLRDRRILYELDVDARATLLRVAKRVGISKDAVKYRIGNLVSSGAAKGFIAVIDTARLGYITFGVFLKFRELTPKKEKELLAYLVSNPRVGWAVSCEGNWDLNMWYWATSIYDFEDFWKDFLSRYRRHIARSWIHIATRLHHYRRKYLLPEGGRADAGAKAPPAVEVLGGAREKVEVDGLDVKILKILVVNARMPLIEIAQKVGASPKVVAYRIQNLIEKKVILFFRVVLDLEKAGYLYYKLHLYLRNMDDEKFGSLMEYCRHQPNVMYVDEKIGGADFELELHVESPEKFREIVADMRQRFSSIIADHESLLYYKEHKLAYLPTEK